MRIRTITVAIVSSLLLASTGTVSAAQDRERPTQRMSFGEVQNWLTSSSPETIRRVAQICTEAESLQAEARVMRREQMARMALAGLENPYTISLQLTDANLRLMQFNLQAQIDYLGPLCPAAIGYVAGEANE